MNRQRRKSDVILGIWFLALGIWLAGSLSAQEAPAQAEGVEVLARGPVHEAYAQPAPPPRPVMPKHEARPIPQYEPRKPPAPPRRK